jgi:hypothetical protein
MRGLLGRAKLDPALLRASKSRVWANRPVCPTCGQRCPERETEWLVKWGHRGNTGEPCPGFPSGYVHVPPAPSKRARSGPALTGKAWMRRLAETKDALECGGETLQSKSVSGPAPTE